MAPASDTSDFYCHQAIAGFTPVRVVAETEDVLAFEHTSPAHPVHVVVVPKAHTPSLVDLGKGGRGTARQGDGSGPAGRRTVGDPAALLLLLRLQDFIQLSASTGAA
ncbi:HIT domain-containing protein [Streptomyces sp. NBC_01476]|uniref:HIT domain-containing protein n=1 Tax=Streptomyces sp. NBC_01476 TaxID=2903881 RepID=UPI002E3539E4|nr:HIT domain-containing protein [Streptomyces sp. NBC_01476]